MEGVRYMIKEEGETDFEVRTMKKVNWKGSFAHDRLRTPADFFTLAGVFLQGDEV
jgi:hypothetical protein